MNKAPIDSIAKAVQSISTSTPTNLDCRPLAGDASDRRYFRVTYEIEGQKRSAVVMDILDVQNICKSEEVTLYHDDSGELPFINIHRFLENIGAPVSEILYFDRQKGLMLLSDLGDKLLLHGAQAADKAHQKQLYQQAIDELAHMQVESEKQREGSDCFAFSQSFAPKLLAWEFDHYIEYGIEAFHNVKIETKARASLTKRFNDLAHRIASMQRVFTHRDYHSRNLMLHNGRTFMIDFQDALFGPLTYDLASLLRDSYIDLGHKLREELIDYYVAKRESLGAPIPDPAQFRTDFSITAMQRNLKAAGRFVFIDRVKGNPAYLESIPRTLSYVARDGGKNKELLPIFEILAKYEPRLEPIE